MFFWSVYPRIRTEYGDLLCKSPYSVQMREIRTRKTRNTDTFYEVPVYYKNENAIINALKSERKEKKVLSLKKYHQGPEQKINIAKERCYSDLESRGQYGKRKYQENPGQRKEYRKAKYQENPVKKRCKKRTQNV